MHFIMRILTRTQYDAICDIVMSQKRLIEQKEVEIRRLKAQVERLGYLLDEQLSADKVLHNIDFPNSHTVNKTDTKDQWR